MKTWTVVFLALIIGSSVGVGLALTKLDDNELRFFHVKNDRPDFRGTKRPKLVVVGGRDHDFNVMERHATGSHPFVFFNDGDEVLKLSAGKTTCSCTVSQIAQSEVQPGESVEVIINWKPKAGSFGGEFRQSATIRTNDPEWPAIVLSVHGLIIQTVQAQPRDISFMGVSAKDTRTARVHILSRRTADFQILNHQLVVPETAAHFDVQTELVSAAKARELGAEAAVLVTVRLKPGLPFGPFRQTIRFTTNLNDVPEVNIPIEGMIASDVSLLRMASDFDVRTNILKLGRSTNGRALQARMMLRVKGPIRKDVELSIGHVEPTQLKASLEKRPATEKVESVFLTIEVPPNSPPGTFRGDRMGRVVIKTTHPQVKEIPIDVQFSVE